MAKGSFGKKSSTKSAVGKSKVIKSGPLTGANPAKGPKMKAR